MPATLTYRSLGNSDIDVSPIAFGTMSTVGSQTYDGIAEQQAIDTIHAAIDAGVNFFDTAPMYGDGAAEELLGKALVGRRDKVVIADKVSSSVMDEAEVIAECDKALKRLRTDYIDLYQVHWNRRAVPLAETAAGLRKLLEAGKVRAVGVCNFGPSDLAEFLELCPCATNQMAYNLLFRGIELEVRELCLKHGVGVLCYSPLAQGLLTGRYRSADEVPSGRARTRHFSKDRPEVRHGEAGCEAATFEAIERVQAICERVGRPMAEVALAWLVHQPVVTSVLAGASRPDQARANAAAGAVQLSDDVLSELDEATRPVRDALGTNLDLWACDSRIR